MCRHTVISCTCPFLLKHNILNIVSPGRFAFCTHLVPHGEERREILLLSFLILLTFSKKFQFYKLLCLTWDKAFITLPLRGGCVVSSCQYSCSYVNKHGTMSAGVPYGCNACLNLLNSTVTHYTHATHFPCLACIDNKATAPTLPLHVSTLHPAGMQMAHSMPGCCFSPATFSHAAGPGQRRHRTVLLFLTVAGFLYGAHRAAFPEGCDAIKR